MILWSLMHCEMHFRYWCIKYYHSIKFDRSSNLSYIYFLVEQLCHLSLCFINCTVRCKVNMTFHVWTRTKLIFDFQSNSSHQQQQQQQQKEVKTQSNCMKYDSENMRVTQRAPRFVAASISELYQRPLHTYIAIIFFFFLYCGAQINCITLRVWVRASFFSHCSCGVQCKTPEHCRYCCSRAFGILLYHMAFIFR